LIVTREVCRFARNTVDTLVTTRELKNLGIEVYFVEDNIWTMDGDGELRLTIMATLAQEESRKVSERVKAGQQISREKGVIYGCGNILGYDRVDGTYVINEEQAETVKLIFDLYCADEYGITQIANILTSQQRKTATGKTVWDVYNVGRILKNATYMGYQAYGKSFSNNYLEQKRISNCNAETYVYRKCDFPAIVSEEQWHEAEAIRKRRTMVVRSKQRKDPFLGDVPMTIGHMETRFLWKKIVRCNCGATMRREKWARKNGETLNFGLRCYDQIDRGSANKIAKLGGDNKGFCDIKMIAEWKFSFMVKQIFVRIFTDKKQKEIINDVIDIVEKCYSEKPVKAVDQNAIENEISRLKSKISNITDMRADGDISKEEYRARRTKLEAGIDEQKK
ncbi:MAG: recombinase family protein, partial [Bacteroidaceae bacterium]|nr:recombinase family protein [Bacteroidaceae bacterium]